MSDAVLNLRIVHYFWKLVHYKETPKLLFEQSYIITRLLEKILQNEHSNKRVWLY